MKAKKQPSNRELRTRKDLLQAAARLLRRGRKPTMDEVAEEAMVSRPTAYRYFSNVDALLAEAPIDAIVPPPEDLFGREASMDPEHRIDLAEAAMHDVVFANEAQLRIMLAHTVSRDPADGQAPRRQNRRVPLIEAALAPARARFAEEDYRRLCAALAVIFGTESMIVFRDVIGLDEPAARQVKSWAVRALVRAALQASKAKPGK